MASCPPSSSDPTAAPPLALPLAREELDRGAVARLDPGHLAASWAREGTEVLWLQGGRAPVADGRLVFTAPSGPVPAEAAPRLLARRDAQRPHPRLRLRRV